MFSNEAFAQNAEKYMDTVFRVAYGWLKNPDDANDVTQDVLIELYKTDKAFESDAHLKNWLIRVTVNRCKMLFRSPWRRHEDIDDYAETLSFGQPQDGELFKAVMALDKKYRVPLLLFYSRGIQRRRPRRCSAFRKRPSAQDFFAQGRSSERFWRRSKAMTEKERFQRAFAPLHASPDTMTEVMKMTERKTKRPALRRTATIGLAAALVLALGSVAYASDLGGIQRTVQLWLNGEMTDATLTVNEGSYTLRYPDKDGIEHEMGGGGIAIEDDGTERALTEEEMLEHLNEPEVEEREDGTVTVYYLDQKLDVTDKFNEDGVCYVQLEGGEKTIYMTIKRGNGYATSTTKYILPNEFNN